MFVRCDFMFLAGWVATFAGRTSAYMYIFLLNSPSLHLSLCLFLCLSQSLQSLSLSRNLYDARLKNEIAIKKATRRKKGAAAYLNTVNCRMRGCSAAARIASRVWKE